MTATTLPGAPTIASVATEVPSVPRLGTDRGWSPSVAFVAAPGDRGRAGVPATGGPGGANGAVVRDLLRQRAELPTGHRAR
jgi:hypothetical protein